MLQQRLHPMPTVQSPNSQGKKLQRKDERGSAPSRSAPIQTTQVGIGDSSIQTCLGVLAVPPRTSTMRSSTTVAMYCATSCVCSSVSTCKIFAVSRSSLGIHVGGWGDYRHACALPEGQLERQNVLVHLPNRISGRARVVPLLEERERVTRVRAI
jgi:hypothetical protein